eukprot:c6967_g1_i1.p1 GENE.c6967_g1_i1~~c6967_g1_i1.p1  ORF type:complete len:415 (-),score=119.11 c6967_g1_i1:80-1324(-)
MWVLWVVTCLSLPQKAVVSPNTCHFTSIEATTSRGSRTNALMTNHTVDDSDHFTSFLEKERDVKKAEYMLGDPRSHPEMFIGVGIVVPVGKKFRMTCECNNNIPVPLNKKLPMQYPKGACGAGDVKIKRLMRGEGYSEPEIRELIGSPIFLTWVRIEQHHFSTIEGRIDRPVLTTPGGDMGEFLNAMDVYEELIHTPLTDGQCVTYLREYLRYTVKKSFYMSTDTSATKMLQVNLGMTGLDVRDEPPPSVRAAVLKALTLPEHVGDSHLRNMMMKPNEYDIRPELPACAIRAFFTLLWNKQEPFGRKLRLVELDGTNQEKAVIKLKTSKTCVNLGIAPLLPPRSSKGTVVLIHSQAAAVMRGELARFFARYNRYIGIRHFLNLVGQNAVKYEELAIFKLARTVVERPVYEVTIE